MHINALYTFHSCACYIHMFVNIHAYTYIYIYTFILCAVPILVFGRYMNAVPVHLLVLEGATVEGAVLERQLALPVANSAGPLPFVQ